MFTIEVIQGNRPDRFVVDFGAGVRDDIECCSLAIEFPEQIFLEIVQVLNP